MNRLTLVVAGLGLLSFTATAQALPLCGAGFGPCRPGLEFGVFCRRACRRGRRVAKARDGVGASGTSRQRSSRSRTATANLADPSLSDSEKCARPARRTSGALRKPPEHP
jgi:hypothetical protein